MCQGFKSNPETPYPHLVPGEIGKTFLDDWKIEFLENYNVAIKENKSISELGGMDTGEDEDEGWQPRSELRSDVFIRGIRPGATCIVTGVPGSGKSEFVVQEIIVPACRMPNVQIVHNMALVNPPKQCKYASSIPDALYQIVNHALKGIKETGHPYLSYWIVDEAGISKDRQRSASWDILQQKYITFLSRKIGCFQITIFQLDEPPRDIRLLATHRFHKPPPPQLDRVEARINIGSFRFSMDVKGVEGWRIRKEKREKTKHVDEYTEYIEFGTYDTSSMDTYFNVKGLLDAVNTMSTDKSMGAEKQFKRILELIEFVKKRSSPHITEESVIHHLYKLRKALEDDKRKEVKAIVSYPNLVLMASVLLPNDQWYENKLRRRFKEEEKAVEFSYMSSMYQESIHYDAVEDYEDGADMVEEIETAENR